MKKEKCGQFLAAIGVVASLVVPQAVKAADKLTFARAAPWGLDGADLNYAKHLGYFSEENIDVDVIVVQGAYAVTQQILAGSADTGFVYPEALAGGMQPGKAKLPMKLVYNYYPRPIFEIAVLPDSPLKKLSDLKGKVIGVANLANGALPLTTAALSTLGIRSADFSFLPIGIGPQALHALMSKQIDALDMWAPALSPIEYTIKLRRLALPEEFNMPAAGFAFTDEFIEKRGDLIARFGRAFAKGQAACAANREDCVRALWKAFPSVKSAGDEQVAMANALGTIDVLVRVTVPPEGRGWGEYADVDFTRVLNAYKVGGMLTNTDIPISELYTNKFVKSYNDFDRAAVEAGAKGK